ncbi:MAG: DUF1566 domain-containing protein [bacterium]
MKRWILIVLILGVIAVGFYFGYYRAKLQTNKEKPVLTTQVIEKSTDNRFKDYVTNGDKVIEDTKTGLFWTPELEQKGLSWGQTTSLVAELNQKRYAGYSNWRMPTIEELREIAEESKKHQYPGIYKTISIDQKFNLTGAIVWSGQTTSNNSSSAWCYDFSQDNERSQRRSNSGSEYRSLAVRSRINQVQNIAKITTARFKVKTDNGDKVIEDTQTKLFWTPDLRKYGLTWEETKAYVEELNQKQYGGYSDWRMPTREELKGICEKSKKHTLKSYDKDIVSIYVDPVFEFNGLRVWSSEIISYNPKGAWVFDFFRDEVNWENLPYSEKSMLFLAVRS